MSKSHSTELPGNLRGYKLKKVHQSFFGRLVLWIIIILAILWFVNKQIIFDLFDFLKRLVSGFF